MQIERKIINDAPHRIIKKWIATIDEYDFINLTKDVFREDYIAIKQFQKDLEWNLRKPRLNNFQDPFQWRYELVDKFNNILPNANFIINVENKEFRLLRMLSNLIDPACIQYIEYEVELIN